MDKILIYTNNLEDIKDLPNIVNQLTLSGFEIAFSTDNSEILYLLTINKQLVVKYNTYFPDFCISNQELKGLKTIPFKEFRRMLKWCLKY